MGLLGRGATGLPAEQGQMGEQALCIDCGVGGWG